MHEYVAKPACVVDYVSKMGCFDLSDQINQYGSYIRKTSNGYKKLFFHMFNLCIVNSFILYQKFSDTEKNSTVMTSKSHWSTPYWKKPQKLPNPTHPEEGKPLVRKLLVSWNATFQRTFLQSQVLKDKGHIETAMHVIARKVQEKDSKEKRLPSDAQIVKLPFVFQTASVCTILCKISRPCYLVQVMDCQVTLIVIEQL